MNDNLPTSEVLNRAADLIEERGWTVGNGGLCVEGPHCLMGGIGAAAGVRPTWAYDGRPAMDYSPIEALPATQAMVAFLGDRVPKAMGQPWLWAWNDDQESAEQVIATLRAAALIEAAKERPANLVVFDAPTLAEAVQA